MVTISVRGESRRLLPPDEATLYLSVQTEGAREEDALADAKRAHAAVVEQAQSAEETGLATRWVAERISTYACHDWIPLPPGAPPGKQQKRVKRFRVSASIRVVFADADAVSSFAEQVASVPNVFVGHVQWGLARATEQALRAELRTEAALDAVNRAAQYAKALGLGVPQPIRVAEEGLRFAPVLAGTAERGSRVGVGSSEPPPLELQPDDVEFGESVTMDFQA